MPSWNAARSAPFGATPEAPFASTSRVSFVLVSPSTEIALNVVSAVCETMRRRSPASTAASVVTNARSVAMFGWIIPAPFATPPMRTVPAGRCTSRSVTLGRVSVVMIARDASSQPLSVSAIVGRTAAMRSTGSLNPITPVLATATSYGEHPRTAAAASAIAIASRSPCSPVQAFALPGMGKNSIYPTNTQIKRKTMTPAALAANRANAARGGRPVGVMDAQRLSFRDRCRRNDERHVESLRSAVLHTGHRGTNSEPSHLAVHGHNGSASRPIVSG